MATGTIMVQGTEAAVRRAAILLRRFDIETQSDRLTRSYNPKHSSARRIKTLIEKLIVAAEDTTTSNQDVRMHTDEVSNRLYVTAAPAIHTQIEKLLDEEDRPTPARAKRTRIYRPQHRPASEILDTLTQLLQDTTAISAGDASGAGMFGVSMNSLTSDAPANRSATIPPGRNRLPAQPGRGQVLPMPPAQERIESPTQQSTLPRRVVGPDYVLTEDEGTNAIIAIGSPEFHEQLADLIAQLDRRPAQVLIEMTLVAVTLSDSVSLGIELEGLDLGDGFDYLLFSNFGLSS